MDKYNLMDKKKGIISRGGKKRKKHQRWRNSSPVGFEIQTRIDAMVRDPSGRVVGTIEHAGAWWPWESLADKKPFLVCLFFIV